MDDILYKNLTVKPDDIAIVFLENNSINYGIIDQLFFMINEKYNWNSTKGYIVKSKEKNHVFISNRNNVKGLEFPFVICVETAKITDDIRKRNSIYMVLTRSFLCSYFVINENKNEEFIDIYKKAVEQVALKGYLELREPSQEEKDLQAEKIKIEVQHRYKSVEDMINEICDEYPNLSVDDRKSLQDMIPSKVRNLSEIEVKTKTRKIIDVILSED